MDGGAEFTAAAFEEWCKRRAITEWRRDTHVE
jgi:hypothetical protein